MTSSKTKLKRTLTTILAVLMLTGALVTMPATATEQTPGILINQVYGTGPDGGSITHSFVELFNPTQDPVNLAGWSLQVQNGTASGVAPTGWQKLDFNNTHIIPSNGSFLIRMEQVAPATARYAVVDYDVSWLTGRLLSNRSFSVALVSNQNLLTMNITPDERAGVVDLLGAVNTVPQDAATNFEVAQFVGISRQAAARRVNFRDTDNNANDFERIDYRDTGINDARLQEVRPRWSGDGTWAVPLQDAFFINEFAKPGVPLVVGTIGLTGTVTYSWRVGNTNIQGNNTNTFTPTAANMENFIQCTVTADGFTKVVRMYASALPVIYIDVDHPDPRILDRVNYKPATMTTQGNDEFNELNSSLYNGTIQIRGRGNWTWEQFAKKPFKLRLDARANPFGLGSSSNRHWVLLTATQDPSFTRNQIVNELARNTGAAWAIESVHVQVVLNGQYQGLYQFTEHVRVAPDRVDIFDWENDVVETAARRIAAVEGMDPATAIRFEDHMNGYMNIEFTNLAPGQMETWATRRRVTTHGGLDWISTDQVTFEGKTYTVSDYGNFVPRNAAGEVDITGGYLIEIDHRTSAGSHKFDTTPTKFFTSMGRHVMGRKPEFVSSNPAMLNYVRGYLNAFEAAISSRDFHTTFEGERVRYSDLFDMESLVKYLVVQEFFANSDKMTYSTMMYKPFNDKFYIGPNWDFDWSWDIGRGSSTSVAGNRWTHMTAHTGLTNWYRYLVTDPYFIVRLYEHYQDYDVAGEFNRIVRPGGQIDTLSAMLAAPATANQARWGGSSHSSGVATVRNHINARTTWMNNQFASIQTLVSSLQYAPNVNLTVTAVDIETPGESTFRASVGGMLSAATQAVFFVNGAEAGIVNLDAARTATITVPDSMLTAVPGQRNVVEVKLLAAGGSFVTSGTYMARSNMSFPNAVSNFMTFFKELEEVTKPADVIINQTFGGGGKADTPFSHSFIELYNTTDEDINLAGYSIGYLSTRPGDPNHTGGLEVSLQLSGVIPARSSYLIRAAAEVTPPNLLRWDITEYDISWPNRLINNGRYYVKLYNSGVMIDAVSLGEGDIMGASLAAAGNKHTTARRVNFQNTGDNRADFIFRDFRVANTPSMSLLEVLRPRSTADGPWDEISAQTAERTTLRQFLARAAAADTPYLTPASRVVLLAAIAAGEPVLANPAASNAAILAALDTLRAALGNLVYEDPADREELEAAIARFEALDPADWTEASWALAATAYSEATAVNGNAEATQAEIDAAAAALNYAIDNLEEAIVGRDFNRLDVFSVEEGNVARLGTAHVTGVTNQWQDQPGADGSGGAAGRINDGVLHTAGTHTGSWNAHGSAAGSNSTVAIRWPTFFAVDSLRVQYSYDAVSGTGGVQLPANVAVEYWDGSAYVPVTNLRDPGGNPVTTVGLEGNGTEGTNTLWNGVTFDLVETTRIRLNITNSGNGVGISELEIFGEVVPVPVTDRTALLAVIAEFEDLTEDDYKPSSWALAKAAYDAAVTVNNNNFAPQAAIDAAAEALSEAIAAIVVLADKTELREAMDRFEELDPADWTEETWTIAEYFYNIAVPIYADHEAEQFNVNAAALMLAAALDALEAEVIEPANYGAVNAALEALKALDRSTVRSGLDELDAAVENIDWYLPITRQDEVDAFAEAINAAFDALLYWEEATFLRINLNAITRVARNDEREVEITINEEANPDKIILTISNPAMATIAEDGRTVITLNRAGTVTLTATDPATNMRHSVTLMIT